MRGLITNSIRSTVLALFAPALLLIAGCGDDSPVAPDPNANTTDPPPVEIKTPTKMRIDYILVESAALVDSNGDSWDLDPFTAANRRPDIYFKLGNYETEVISNYDPASQVGPQRLDFSAPTYGRMNYDGSYTLELYDKDGALQGADDLIGKYTFRPDAMYGQDNRTDFIFRFVDSNKFSAWARGVWIY